MKVEIKCTVVLEMIILDLFAVISCSFVRQGLCTVRHSDLSVSNGDYRFGILNFEVSYTCNPGFTLYGHNQLTCFGMKWNYLPPMCIVSTTTKATTMTTTLLSTQPITSRTSATTTAPTIKPTTSTSSTTKLTTITTSQKPQTTTRKYVKTNEDNSNILYTSIVIGVGLVVVIAIVCVVAIYLFAKERLILSIA